MIIVRAGQKWRDMDKRRERVFEVLAVDPDAATVRTIGAVRTTRIALDRFADNVCKYELAEDAPAQAQAGAA